MLAGSGGVAAMLRAFNARLFGQGYPPGSIVGAAAELGHRLRDDRLPAAEQETYRPIVIVGGGIAGLAAAWKLHRSGVREFVLLELDVAAGGNARSGRNARSAYPWGAHYLPIPGPDAYPIIELLSDLGVITGRSQDGLPIYDEEALCADPHERLLLHGVWQEGLVPRRGLAEEDRRELAAFFASMQRWKDTVGSDGVAAFAIPVDRSSQDPALRALDRMTMSQWMDEQGWRSPYLRWYVNYCCRDDYGCTLDQTSAWAGIHYFAARVGRAANAEANAVLTWPEGMGWIVQRLIEKVGDNLHTSHLVFDAERNRAGWTISYYDAVEGRSLRLRCDAVIFAAPRFVASRVIRDLRQQRPTYLEAFTYAPWMVANLSLDRLPHGNGAPLSWDNVSYTSPSLGYVVATHQEIRRYPKPDGVLTYYWPLSEHEPQVARQMAFERTHEQWCDLILADLENMHPGISREVTGLDVWIWAHAMIRPIPGFIWGTARQQALQQLDRLWFAHSDMSGISIFEEAWWRGVGVAEQLMTALSLPFRSSLTEAG